MDFAHKIPAEIAHELKNKEWKEDAPILQSKEEELRRAHEHSSEEGKKYDHTEKKFHDWERFREDFEDKFKAKEGSLHYFGDVPHPANDKVSAMADKFNH